MNTSGAGGGSGGGGGPFTPGPLLSGVAGNNNDTTASAVQAGDLVIGSVTPLWTRLGIGTTGQALTVSGSGLPAWAVLGVAGGGTSFSTYTTGDLLYASAANTLSKLAIGTNGFVLTVSGGVPVWAAASGGASSDAVFQFLPAQNEPPTTNPGTFGVLTAATGQRPYLEFDGTTDETSIMTGVARNYAGSGITVTVFGTMDSNNTGTKVVKLSCAFELVQSGDVLGAGGNDFAGAQSVEATVDNTAGTCFTATLAFTDGAQMDGVVTGSLFRFKVTRNNSGLTGTNATGRFRMLAAIGNN